jgi:glutamate 5-kinase
MDIVPIINENDAVSYQEIRLGDNDCISARVADLLQAKHLIILSDVKGLMHQDKVIEQVTCLTKDIFSLAKKEDKIHTSGGMITKLEAAQIALAAGVHTTIAYGRQENVIQDIVKGEKVGTLFLAQARKHKARKRWIAFSKKVKGTLVVDAGARDAIINKGKSLLAVGIIDYQGDFKQSDKVAIVDVDNRLLGYGISNYNKKDLTRGKKFDKEVIHRDNFVKITE